MDEELWSNNASNSSVSMDSSRSSNGSLRYMRKVSSNLLNRPKKLATSFLKAREKRKSISAEDVTNLHMKETKSFTKVQSLGREGQMRTSSSYYELNGNSTYSTSKRHTISFVQPLILITDNEARSDNNSFPMTYEFNEYLDVNRTSQIMSAKKLNTIKDGIKQCKKDMAQFETNLNLFKTEFRDGIESINAQIKEDEFRYTMLCYKILNMSDSHQTQLQYLHTLIENMEEDNSKNKDECIIEMLCEKLKMLDSRVARLKAQ